ncbi:hypothetical protein ACIP6P_14095 [Streptomyces sp. NPDC088729]|uniref:hypothetical protein n=1 Tax=Streptomyces sp. NPDC088729 TaxID=3365876 RepID=UPI00382ED0ED
MSEHDDRSVPEASPAPRPEPLPAVEDTEAIAVYGRTATETTGPAGMRRRVDGRDEGAQDRVLALPEPPPHAIEAAPGTPFRVLGVRRDSRAVTRHRTQT